MKKTIISSLLFIGLLMVSFIISPLFVFAQSTLTTEALRARISYLQAQINELLQKQQPGLVNVEPTLNGPPFPPAQLISGLLAAADKIQSAHSVSSLNISLGLKEATTKPLSSYGLGIMSSNLSDDLLVTNPFLQLSLDNSFNRRDDTFPEGKGDLSLKAKFDQKDINLTASVVVKNKALYLKFSEIPSWLQDRGDSFSVNIQNKWIKIVLKDLEKLNIDRGIKIQNQHSAMVKKLWSMAGAFGVIVAEAPTSVRLAGGQVGYQYRLHINRNNLIRFVRPAWLELKNTIPSDRSSLITEEDINQLINDLQNDPKTQSFFKFLEDNSSWYVTLEANTGFVRQMRFDLRVAPDAGRQQINFSLNFWNDQINQPMTIKVPSKFTLFSSIVDKSIATAQLKARNAAAKAALSSMRAEAELAVDPSYYRGDHSALYPADLCIIELADLLKSVDQALEAVSGNGPDNIKCNVSSDKKAWAASAKLNDTADRYCVDSTGLAQVGSKQAVAGVCR